MKTKLKRIVAVATGALAVAGIGVLPSLVTAWGDNAGGRKSYTIEQINAGALGDTIVFNSISNSVDGDEKNFVSAQKSTDNPQGTWQGNNITVENGQTYTIRLYAHNNNPNGYKAVAEDTHVYFSIPQKSAKQIQVNGFIESSNATPSEYWDYVNFNSDNNAFHLEYVYGSALLYNNKIGLHGTKLSDEIVTKATSGGVLIGYDALDGKVPGCYQYDNYVTIQVKAVYDTDYTVEKKVRLIGGEKVWSNYVNAKVGDTVEFQIEYKNTSTQNETQNNVMIKDVMPKNLQYVAGTTKIWNSEHNGGLVTPDGAIIDKGINIGSYAPGANAYIRFRATVVDNSLACGSNTLVNWAQAGVGKVTIQDYASVILQKETCPKEDPVLYNLTVNYVYSTGGTAAPSYTGKFYQNDYFKIASPVIAGYTADYEVITGQFGTSDLTYTVVYTPVPAPKPDPTYYNLTIKYVYEDGTEAAAAHTEKLLPGATYDVTSPTITGYTADHAIISGTMAEADAEYAVTYKKVDLPPKPGVDDIPDEPVKPEPEPTPAPTPSITPVVKTEQPSKLPSTGSAELGGSLVASGSLITASGYYLASRKQLKK